MSTHLITRGQPPKLAARKPTGKPTWPMLLLAGAQKTGKSYSSALFSTSDLIDRMFYIEVGEGAIDQYGAIPGARFEVLEHDGTFMSIARQVWAATLVPRGPSGKPHAIVLDSATEVWDLLSGEQQELANARRARKQNGNQTGADEAPIAMDQWNTAKKRWRALVDLLRSHDGPVIWTGRFEEIAVMGENGKPVEGKKAWKIRTEKNLPFEVDGIIEMPRPRECYVTGIRSLRLQLDPGEHRLVPDFTIDGLLRALGLDEEVGQRHYTAPNSEAYVGEYDAEQAENQQRRGEQPGSGSERLRSAMGPAPAPRQAVNGQQQGNGQSAPAGITQPQLTALNVGLTTLGYKDRPAIYALLTAELGREITSSADLTKAEASTLIDRIKRQEIKPPAPAAEEPGDDWVPEPPADWQPEDDGAQAGAR